MAWKENGPGFLDRQVREREVLSGGTYPFATKIQSNIRNARVSDRDWSVGASAR